MQEFEEKLFNILGGTHWIVGTGTASRPVNIEPVTPTINVNTLNIFTFRFLSNCCSNSD